MRRRMLGLAIAAGIGVLSIANGTAAADRATPAIAPSRGVDQAFYAAAPTWPGDAAFSAGAPSWPGDPRFVGVPPAATCLAAAHPPVAKFTPTP